MVQKPTHEGRQSLALISRKVATAVTELVQSAEAIKGKKDTFIIYCIHIQHISYYYVLLQTLYLSLCTVFTHKTISQYSLIIV